MDAVVLDRFGGPEVLRAATAPDPVPAAGERIVRLRAAALNWHDVLVRRGLYGSPLPHIPGADGAGVTDDGEEVVILPSLRWGDRAAAPGADWGILGDHEPGTYAQAVRVPADCVIPKPAGLSWEQAAALPLVGVTAYRALVTRGALAAGEWMLVLGAGGGVAPMAVAIARALGAVPVVTSSSRDKIARAEASGADGGVLYTDDGWPEAARALTPDGRGFDLVLDAVGTWDASLRALRPGGRLVVLGASRAEQATIAARPFYFGQYSLLGTTMGGAADLRGLLDLLASRRLAPPVVDSVHPLAEAAAAHRRLESGEAYGKIVLTIG
jgi:zinc-binding alcohol dehydrogenase/oxidoreductase